MKLSSHISHGSKAFLVVAKDFILFNKCGEDGGEYNRKEFVDGACEHYEFVVCDNYGWRSMVILCFHSQGIAFWWQHCRENRYIMLWSLHDRAFRI